MDARDLNVLNDKINTLTAAVARLLFDRGDKEICLGMGGTLIAVADNGQVSIDGEPVGDADSGHKHTASTSRLLGITCPKKIQFPYVEVVKSDLSQLSAPPVLSARTRLAIKKVTLTWKTEKEVCDKEKEVCDKEKS